MNDIKPIKFCGVDSKRPVVIAGPCSAETEEQVMETAKDLAKNGVRIFRAGIWKPRTKPGGFEGVGSVGLTWLQEVKKETGMLVATEVANKQHVEEALNAGVDVLWIWRAHFGQPVCHAGNRRLACRSGCAGAG